MKRLTSCIILVSLTYPLLLSSCTLPVREIRYLRAYLANPANNIVVGLGDTVRLSAVSDSSTGREVTINTFYANGREIGATTDLEANTYPDSSLIQYYGDFNWIPPAAGEYFVQVAANRGSFSATSEAIRVCVIDFTIESGNYDGAYGYEGPCPLPESPSAPLPGAIRMIASASPETVLYDPTWAATASCPGAPSLLTFEATVVDPPDDVRWVAVSYSMMGNSASRHPGETESRTLVLTERRRAAPSTKYFSGTTESLLVPLSSNFVDQPGDIAWTATAYAGDGAVLRVDGPNTIPAMPCTLTPLIAPFTAEPPTPSPTPASAADCPPGTYFAEVTHRCIAIEIAPESDKDGDGGSCQPPPGGCDPKTQYWSPPTCSCQVLQ